MPTGRGKQPPRLSSSVPSATKGWSSDQDSSSDPMIQPTASPTGRGGLPEVERSSLQVALNTLRSSSMSETWLARVVTAAEQSLHGIFNAAGDPTTLGDLLRTCQDTITGSRAILAWVGDDDLLAAGLSPWMGVPLWIAMPGWEAHAQVDNTKARDAGLSFRPMDQTIRDTLAWDLARGGPPSEVEGLTPSAKSNFFRCLSAERDCQRASPPSTECRYRTVESAPESLP